MSGAAEIAAKLTAGAQDCIRALSGDWQQRGYSKAQADLLWAADVSLIARGLPALVDCRLHDEPGQGRFYQHRLTETGLEVRAHLSRERGE